MSLAFLANYRSASCVGRNMETRRILPLNASFVESGTVVPVFALGRGTTRGPKKLIQRDIVFALNVMINSLASPQIMYSCGNTGIRWAKTALLGDHSTSKEAEIAIWGIVLETLKWLKLCKGYEYEEYILNRFIKKGINRIEERYK